VITPAPDTTDPEPPSLELSAPDEELSAVALEAAYRRALEVADAATAMEVELGGAFAEGTPVASREGNLAGGPPETVAIPAGGEGGLAGPTPTSASAERTPGVTPKQVVEALLFVGGQPLTGKRLADLLGGEITHEHVDVLVDGLNSQYEQEGRPYEVRLAEGGYRLELRPEFERVRDRVYGYGPKEVKLSQDALEVLALVAYQQPVTREIVEQTGKANASAVLRQLLRRELIVLRRGDGGKDDVTYHTTPRFLQLFGLGSLNDLPLPEDLMFK
jgi:segregation and condensation protein B